LNVLTLWPSFSLLVFFLVIFLECRTLGGRVTLPLGSFLMVFCYGAIGAPLLALLLQQIPLFPNADADPASPIAWLIGPPVEELTKALPVIVLAFLTRESRRLSIADLTLIGFASGAGFGFVEANLNALVNGTLPGVQYIAAFGLQSQADAIFFAGHPVSTALVGLAAGIGLRFLQPTLACAWAPAAAVILWASFDHGIYNWKLLHAAAGALPQAHFVAEALHLLTLSGQLQTWLLPAGLIAAQFFEARLCSKAVGARRDLLLAREWRPWVVNEWFVALMRAPLGRAAFAQTLGYFRLRRAFYLAAFEARRDPKNITLTRHARSLEDRLKRERAILFDPPRGTWLLPLPVLKAYAAQWLWRMRWVLIFAFLLLLLFMLDPAGLPVWLRQFLFGEIFTASVVVAGVAFAVWRIVVFARLPRPDPLTAEGAACAGYYTRALLLGCAFVCGLFPTLTLLLGWKAFAPGAAFISGYLPGWIAQGGNLQTLLGLGTIGAAVAPDPRPSGEALRHEIAAADDRMRRLGSEIAEKIGAPEGGGALHAPAPFVEIDAFLDAMAKLDDERDAQARRQLALDECARQAAVSTIKDPAPTVQGVKDEFDRLAAELLESAARELDAVAALEQAYGRTWIEIMQDLDAHDVLRRRLRTPLRTAWQIQNEIAWALRVVESSDECLLPMQLTLLPELDALATTVRSERAARVAEGVERIRAAAEHYGAADPYDFAVGTNAADEDEAALLAEFASAAPSAEAPKSFGLRTPQASDEPAGPVEHESAPVSKPSETEPPAQAEPRAQHYQEALDQLIDTIRRDQAYLDTIRHLELSDEPAQSAPATTETSEPRQEPSAQAEIPTIAPPQAQAGEVEDLIDAIKRDSGYLAFAREREDQDVSEPADGTREAAPSAPGPAADHAVDTREDHAPDLGHAEPTMPALQAFDTAEPLEVARVNDDTSALVHEPPPDDVGALGEDTAPDVGETGPAAVAQEQGTVVPADYAADVREVAAAVDNAAEIIEIDTPSVAEALGSDSARSTESAPTANDAPALEFIEAAESTSDVVQSDTPNVADTVDPETAVSQDLDTHTELAAPITTPPGEVLSEEPHAVETGPQAVDEPAPQPDVEDVYLDDGAAMATIEEPAPLPSDVRAEFASPEPTDLLILDSDLPSARDEPSASETLPEEDARTETLEPEPTARPVEAPEASRAAEEPQARTEVRTSLFKRLLQSMQRPPAEPMAQLRRVDQPAQEQKELKLENRSNESIAPAAAPWLSDLAAPAVDGETARPDQVFLEPIEWPAPKALVDAAADTQPAESGSADATPVEAAIIDSAKPTESESIDVADLQPQQKSVSDDVRPAEAHAADTAADIVSLEAARDAEHAPEVAPDAAMSIEGAPVADEGPEPSSAAPEPDATSSAPQQVDEFSSKADRLAYLLAKLEGAIQAKAAADAVAHKVDAESAPRDPDPALNAEANGHARPAVESVAVAEPAPATPATSEPEPEPTGPDESVALIVETAPVEAPAHGAETSETSVETAATEPRHPPKPAAELIGDDRRARPAPGELKPDRLSYLLTKLFETAKRQPPEPTADLRPIGDSEPATTKAAAAIEEHGDEILDLRLPHLPHTDSTEPDDVQKIEFDPLREQPVEPPPPEALTPPEATAVAVTPPVDTASMPAREAASADHSDREATAASTPSSDAVSEPAAKPRRAEPGLLFGASRPPRPRPAARPPKAEGNPAPEGAPTPAIELKPTLPTPTRAAEPSESSTPATTPKRDWKLGARSDQRAAEDNTDSTSAAKKSESTFRLKTGSGALATVDAPPPGALVAAEKAPAKYYGPKHAVGGDSETGTASTAQQRALSLADALAEYYGKTGQPQPPMHTTDRATLQRIIINGKLEAPLRRGAPWSISGMLRRGEVAIRLKPGAEKFVEFVPSREIFGQVPHYYPRGVGKGDYATHVPAEYLEHFDLATRQWAPVQRG
jgi:RsiW-degrading membrane proteinase PrsW (M82 family)